MWGWYFNHLNHILGDMFYDMVDDLLDYSSGSDDMDLDIPSSDDIFAEPLSNPIYDDSVSSTDSLSSQEHYDLIVNQCLDVLDAAEQEVQTTHVLCPSIPISHAPQIHLLEEWHLHNPR